MFIAALIAIASLVGDELTVPPDPKSVGDQVCGPRCVQYLLQSLGDKLTLSDAIKSLQWPEVERGISFQQMQAYLNSRGVHARFETLEHGEYPEVSGLAVVANRKPDGTNHFVVVLEARRSGEVLYWDGLLGTSSENAIDFWARAYPAILLVGKAEPAVLESYRYTVLRASTWLSYILGFVVLGSVVVSFFRQGKV